MHHGDVAGWTPWADHRIAVTPTVEGAYAEAVRRYADGLEAADGDIDKVVVMAPQNSVDRRTRATPRRWTST